MGDILDKDHLPGGFKSFLRTMTAAVITMIIGVVLFFGINNLTSAESRHTAEDILHANLATACVLALPLGVEGRDPIATKFCFTQYGLDAPLLVVP